MKFTELQLQLAKYRNRCHYSQEALAEKIGVSRQAVTKWENGETIPELPKLIALADLLHVSLDSLTGRGKTIYDLAKESVENCAANHLHRYDEADVLPFLCRFMEFGEQSGMTAENIMNGILFICQGNSHSARQP